MKLPLAPDRTKHKSRVGVLSRLPPHFFHEDLATVIARHCFRGKSLSVGDDRAISNFQACSFRKRTQSLSLLAPLFGLSFVSCLPEHFAHTYEALNVCGIQADRALEL